MNLALLINAAHLIAKEAPNVARVLKDVGAPVAKALVATKTIVGVHLDGEIHISDGCEQAHEAWKLFRESVIKFCKIKCQESASLARENLYDPELVELLAIYIVDEYYKRYPCWPKSDCSQSATLYISTVLASENPVQTKYCMLSGEVYVCDSRCGSKYTARVDGKLDLKIIGVDKHKLRTIERTIIFDEEGFITNVQAKFGDAQANELFAKLVGLSIE